MKGLFSYIVKAILIITLVTLAGLTVFGLILIMDWPWWIGLFLFLGIIGLWAGVVFLKRLILKRREEKFIQQIIARDEAYLKQVAGTEKERLRDLQQRWKEAVKTLKRSHLRKVGNPLYVLPWYMVIGESGSGKTTAIRSARLSSPFAESIRTSGISGTRNCDWWFFEQAVIIDTAGRYAIPLEPGKDKEEWQKFLELLVKYRKKEPLNGLIVTVAADKLIRQTTEVVEQDGLEIRKRINELIKVLGVKFPVYVMVTKCDLIQGMSEFSNTLPDHVLDQAMGLRKDDDSDPVQFAARAVDVTAERLKDLRLLLLGSKRTMDETANLLLFPEEFQRLKSGLKAFMHGAFAENPYQETPLLKGIYFSSGRQEGTPYSHFLHSLGLIKEKEILPGTNRGLFLHDFFSKILPQDRSLIFPTVQRLQWQNITRNLGLVSWILVGIAVCGLLSLSFMKNLYCLREVSKKFYNTPTITGQLISDISTLDRFRNALLKVEQCNRHWWIPRFGLNKSIEIEADLKERYCSWFHDLLLKKLDQSIAIRLAGFNEATSHQVLAEYLPYIVRRINLYKAYLAGKGLKNLSNMPMPGSVPDIQDDSIPAEEIERLVDTLFLYYLVWNSKKEEIVRQENQLRSWLRHLFSTGNIDLKWIVTWINTKSSLEPITLNNFWHGNQNDIDGPKVLPAFTKEGNKLRLAFIKELEDALDSSLLIARQKKVFDEWYFDEYQRQWFEFSTSFSKAVFALKTRQQWQQHAMRMTTDNNPYFELLDQLADQLQPIAKESKIPSWISFVLEIQSLKKLSRQEAVVGRAQKAVSAISQKGKSLLKMVNRGASKRLININEEQLKAVKALKDYMKNLSQAASIVTSRNNAYKTARSIFSGNQINGRNFIVLALKSILKMKTFLDHDSESDAVIWQLIQGPVDFLWSYTCLETACYLQEQWEQQVLSQAQGPVDWTHLKKMLLGKGGKVWTFLKGPAGPFVSWKSGKGYFAREVMGAQVPFLSEFFQFLNQSAAGSTVIKENYHVTVIALPTDVNREAALKPQETKLELQCSSGNQILVNLNYPISRGFAWSPSACGDVILKINIGNLTLTKQYVGFEGFPRFLEDFRDGQRIFHPEDFPDQKDALERLRIRFIRVQFKFRGNLEVLKLLRMTPDSLPGKIAICWD